MRKFILAVIILIKVFSGFSQNVITNKEPAVSIDGFKTLFIGLDNPVTISTGSLENVKFSINNGSITHLGNGKCLIRPTSETDSAILKLETSNKVCEFIFKVRSLPFPELRLAGIQYDHAVRGFKLSLGLNAILKNFYYEAIFVVESFDISFSGEGFDQEIHRTNTGAAWDSDTKTLINKCQPGTKVVINNVYFKGPDGRTKKHWEELSFVLP